MLEATYAYADTELQWAERGGESRNYGFLGADKNGFVKCEDFAKGTTSDLYEVPAQVVWMNLCLDDDDAKGSIKYLPQYYIKISGRWEVGSGLEEHLWQCEITSAVSFTEA
ncbi:hypothetical protein N0V93_010326 [Gnomoniopsis smithogilvyi]|uniref:Uncharacterized protein n=1 Tax=Gnomoniopsis smithogilvyi TaxID=1191159 RepID=A0A9W8YJ25_9PEZI|nr:hypothetical protein N0V93_010326 [Gnomoniopsis smithogilvyi]